MSIVTALIAIAAALLVCILPRAMAVGVYLAALCLYPQYLAVSVLSIDFTVGRIVILVLIVRLIARRRSNTAISITWLDVFVLLTWAGASLALFTNAPVSKVIVREGGTFIDTILPYIAIRLAIRNRNDFFTILKSFLYISIPLSVMGAFQAITGINPFGFTKQFDAWNPGIQQQFRRMGFYRADVTFEVSIAFGLFFVALVPMALCCWRGGGWSPHRTVVFLTFVLVGLFSSMSSAPIFALVVVCCFIPMFRYRHLWPYMVIALSLFILAVELYSDRHFYHVLTRFAFSTDNGYYRIGLMEEALGGGMNGHWLFGYGYVGIEGPGVDNSHFHWFHKDLVNIYIDRLARYGLAGLVPYAALNFLYYRRLYVAERAIRDRGEKWIVWCFAATLVSWNVAMMTVGAISQLSILLHVFIGLCGNMLVVFRAEPGRITTAPVAKWTHPSQNVAHQGRPYA